MSRTGKKPVVLVDQVRAQVKDGVLIIQGPLGKHEYHIPQNMGVEVTAKEILVKRPNDESAAKSNHGLIRALIQNMVTGVSTGFEKILQIEGVGYRAEIKGQDLNISLGFSHPVSFVIPKDLKVTVEKQTRIILKGFDKAMVGQTAADIRAFRPPEPYKGKGIRYEGEIIQRKVGKAAASTGAGTK